MTKNVVVIGMHRSGTSAITNALGLLGCLLGDTGDFMSPKRWNPQGNWEHQRLIDRNDLVLELHGGTWFAPPRLAGGWAGWPKAQAMVPRLRSEFAQIYPEEGWVWKDPRACLTLPLWLEAWNSPPVAVMAFRHPLAVAKSLAARNGFSLRHSLALWEAYNSAALWNLRDVPTALYGYETALNDPAGFVSELSAALERHGVALSGSPTDAASALNPSLRRNTADRDDLGSLTKTQRNLWELLNTLAEGGEWPANPPPPHQPLRTRLGLYATVPPRRRAALVRARLRSGLGRHW